MVPFIWNVQDRQIYRDRPWGWRVEGEMRRDPSGYRVSVRGDESVWKFIWMVEQLCEYTKPHWILHFKWMSYVVLELYVDKAVIFNLKILFIYSWETEGDRERQKHGEGEAGSMQRARCRTRSQDPRITPWGRRQTLNCWTTQASPSHYF